MTHSSLFDEMDKVADLLRANNPDLHDALRDELAMEFRQLQKRLLPQLSREQAAEAFEVWLLRDLSSLMAERDKALAGILAAIDHAAAHNGPGQPFICPCGAVLTNPGDPAVIAAHQPHVIAARKRSGYNS